MTWVRKDDEWPLAVEWEGKSPDAESLYDRALAYANRRTTDGHIPLSALPGIVNPRAGHLQDAIDELLEPNPVTGVGLWTKGVLGYVITDYHLTQPSRAEVLADKERAKARTRRWREKKLARDGDGDASQEASRNASLARALPAPSRPVPGTQVSMKPVNPGPVRRHDPREYPVSGLDERMAPHEDAVPLTNLLTQLLPPKGERQPGREATA